MDQPIRKVNKRLKEQESTSYTTNSLLVRSCFYTQSISEQVVIVLNVLLQIQFTVEYQPSGRHGDLMFCALDSRLSGLSPGWGHYLVTLGNKLHSHSASLHSGVQMGTDQFNAGGNPAVN